jgi:MFS family permease
MRGRVMALYMAVLMGGTPIGAPLVGALAEAFGARWSLIAGGLISAGAAIVAGSLLARRQGLVLRDELHLSSARRSDPRFDAVEETVSQG